MLLLIFKKIPAGGPNENMKHDCVCSIDFCTPFTIRIRVTAEESEYPLDLYAQTQEITGIVLDAETQEPIPWAEIRPLYSVARVSEKAYPMPTKSDGNGRFVIKGRETGTFPYYAFKEGYRSQEFDLTFSPNQLQSSPDEIGIEVLLERSEKSIEAHLYLNGQPIRPNNVHFMLYMGNIMRELPAEPLPEQVGVYRVTGLPDGMIEMIILSSEQDGSRRLIAFPELLTVEERQTARIFINFHEVIYYQLKFSTTNGMDAPMDPNMYQVEIPEFPEFQRYPIVKSLGFNEMELPVPIGRHRVRLAVQGFRPIDFIPADIARPSIWGRMEMNLTLEQ